MSIRRSGDLCVVDGCGREAISRGLCRSHYDRLRYSGRTVKQRMSRACLNCGRFFETDRKDRLFCCQPCRDRFRYRRRTCTEKPRREPTPLRSVDWESGGAADGVVSPPSSFYSMRDVWARCDGVCAVCGGDVDLSVSALSDAACVLVWRLPPSSGGVSDITNRLIVHRGCLARYVPDS